MHDSSTHEPFGWTKNQWTRINAFKNPLPNVTPGCRGHHDFWYLFRCFLQYEQCVRCWCRHDQKSNCYLYECHHGGWILIAVPCRQTRRHLWPTNSISDDTARSVFGCYGVAHYGSPRRNDHYHSLRCNSQWGVSLRLSHRVSWCLWPTETLWDGSS